MHFKTTVDAYNTPHSTTKVGTAYALLCYLFWGIIPIYWKWLQEVSYGEILAHRVFWSAIFFFGLLTIKYRTTVLLDLKMAIHQIRGLTLSALLIASNWFVYIYAVNSGQVLEASLGYFINPLVNVLLGRVFLKEKLAPLQKAAVLLAAIGVLQLALQGDHIPYIALFLAFSFGTYGLIRKQIPVLPLTASTFESVLLAPLALGFILYCHLTPSLATPSYSFTTWFLLVLAGVVTGLPLLWFAEAAKRLSLSTLGFIQYLTPTMQFCIAVFLYKEPFTSLHARSFICIWLGLGLYTYYLLTKARRSQKARATIAESQVVSDKPWGP